MTDRYTNDAILDVFMFETSQLVEQLEQTILSSEKSNLYTQAAVNEIFRIMHTLKGSSGMMNINGISTLTHSIEDLFYFLREEKPRNVDYSDLSDLVLEGADFIKVEVEKLKNGDAADGDASVLIDNIKAYLSILKRDNTSSTSIKSMEPVQVVNELHEISRDKAQVYMYRNAFNAVIHFEEGCEMENIRAYTIIHNLKGITDEISYKPEDIIENDDSIDIIRRDGFRIYLKADCSYEELYKFFMQTVFLKDLELTQLENGVALWNEQGTEEKRQTEKETRPSTAAQSMISVSVGKLDKLMDLVGEMVIAESMVIQNPDLQGLELDNFRKSARQLSKITNEMQDMVMSIRMVPLSNTFHKMHRIVRDMSKKLDREVRLEIVGEETEVDKNIIEHISDPLMHLVRNALDHGIEPVEERQTKGKQQMGTITLEAKNAGSDVLIIVKDDGKGLNKEKILKKAGENGLLSKAEGDMTDREIFSLILLPGFSTKDSITEFSGRGVGMDVVSKNIESLGGSVSVDSMPDKGTTVTLKIPLTLAIIDGMNIKVGASCYTIPTISIKESFKPKESDITTDPDGNEMIMVRGCCYLIRRLHELYKVKTGITRFDEGILIMVEQDDRSVCVFADELLGQQQVVVKTLPEYIRRSKKTRGLSGCTLLGDGSISLILDIGALIGL